jgi:hypothetical protein
MAISVGFARRCGILNGRQAPELASPHVQSTVSRMVVIFQDFAVHIRTGYDFLA